MLSERRAVLDNVDTIAAFAEDMSEFLMTSGITESRAFIKSFVKEIKVKPGKATVYYTIPISQSTPKTAVFMGGRFGCNERGRAHLLAVSARQIASLVPNGLMTGPCLDRWPNL